MSTDATENTEINPETPISDNASAFESVVGNVEATAPRIAKEGERQEAEEQTPAAAQELTPDAPPTLSQSLSEDEVDGIVGETAGAPEQDAVEILREAADAAGKEDAGSTQADTNTDAGDDTHSASEIVRTATPGSRTSTPPPGAANLVAPKKFSAVNVTKKFLSKTAAPPAALASGSKLGINGRPSASPVPISTSSSRLLSTKLTTAPLSKSSSPNPPPPGVTPVSSSPWAKPAVTPEPLNSAVDIAPQAGLRRPAGPTAPAMGLGQGLMGAKGGAWRSVAPDGRPRVGMSRDFPTTKEIADGKMAAQAAAQAHAAHNEALMQSINAFTNLDSGHRWDDEDDEDDVLDFGDDIGPPPVSAAPAETAPPSARSERYVAADDFDRSWPRKAPLADAPRRTEEGRDRVLFNANSNRLEPSLPRPQAPPAPTRLMSRGAESGIRPPGPPTHPSSDRPLPPHLQALPQPAAGGRALPPHMGGLAPVEARSQPPPAPPTRSAWNLPREQDRRESVPPSQQRRDSQVSPSQSNMPLPGRTTWRDAPLPPPQQPADISRRPPPHQPSRVEQQAPAKSQPPTSQPPPLTSPTVPGPQVDDQSAEMHTAAERARLRRLAEEAERNAAAERAKRKAKELEERLGIKQDSPPKISSATAPAPPTAPALLRRPGSMQGANNATPTTTAGRPEPALAPPEPVRPVESSWRARSDAPASAPPGLSPPQTISQPSILARSKVDTILTSHAQAEPSLRAAIQAKPDQPVAPLEPAHTPAAIEPELETIVRLPGQAIMPSPELTMKRESGFDSMLARIQAAMAEARLPPSAGEGSDAETATVPAPSQATERRSSQALQPTPAAPHILPRPAVHDYFNATQIDPPRSPPPAWRTYTVRLSPSPSSLPPIPAARLKQYETPLQHPQGWLLSFHPPLEIPPTQMLADQLLPRPLVQRLGRPVESTPLVSISPRRLEPFVRRGKKLPSPVKSKLPEVVQLPSVKEALINPAPSQYRWQPPKPTSAMDSATWSSTISVPAPSNSALQLEIPAVDTLKKPRSPVRSSPAAKAEKEGRFMQDAVSVNPIGSSRAVTEPKPGVRFMVSSELEGDSLLDEVNKMSLETVGEGEGVEKEDLAKTPGSETPRTPPSLSAVSSRGQIPSPSGTSTPWSKTPTRGTAQHDHLKSVWDLAGSNEGSTRTSDIPSLPLTSVPLVQPSHSLDSNTPTYASLNAPPSSELPPSQPLPPSSANKLGYGVSPQTAAAFLPAQAAYIRSPQGHPYGYTPSPTGSIEAYGLARPNGYSMQNQQGLWSPAAFGASMTSPGYGYGGKPADPKTQHQHVQQQHASVYAYSQAQIQAQQNAAAGAYGYAYPAQGAGSTTTAAVAANQASLGRFAQSQPQHHAHGPAQQPNGQYAQQAQAYGNAGDTGGYYGGVGPQQQQAHSQQNAHQHHPQQQYSAGAVGQQIMRGGRKMW